MKKLVSLLLSVSFIFATFTTSFAKTGDVIGYAKYTDISAYINHYPITSYNINDYTAVVAEDLRNYGFNVEWNGDSRSLFITKNDTATQITPYGTVYRYSAKAGQKSFPYLQTDIITYVNGNQVESFNIDGKTCVYIDSLAPYGEVAWVPEIRAIKLWIESLPIKDYVPIEEEPMTTMYADDGNKIAFVDSEVITDLDVNYYIYAQVMKYANQNGISEEDLKNFDWNQEVDGKKLSNIIKQKAVDEAIREVVLIQKGAENGVVISDEEMKHIDKEVTERTLWYGEDGFKLRVRTMGIPNAKQYAKMYKKAMAAQNVEIDIEEKPYKYYPVDVNVLNNYIQPYGATVKHILVSRPDLARKVLERAKKGEDFDALVEAFGEDPGANYAGYTFGEGEMVHEFEKASFALKIGEISDIVETTYGYHIIKRIPGMYELQGYWRSTADIKVNNEELNKLSVQDIMEDVFNAMKALEIEESAFAG